METEERLAWVGLGILTIIQYERWNWHLTFGALKNTFLYKT